MTTIAISMICDSPKEEVWSLSTIGRKTPTASTSPKPIDVSWKYRGLVYKRKTSRVGDDFNATSIPVSGTFKSLDKGAEESEELKLYVKELSFELDAFFVFVSTSNSLQSCDLVFDFHRAEENGVMTYIDEVPHNKKEAAIACAAKHNYDVAEMRRSVECSKPHDGSDWTANEKEEFKRVFYSQKKDVVTTAKKIGKPINDVFTYYLGSFKKSDDYRLLKVICDESRAEKNASSEHGLDACGYCGDGGSLLICDGCEGEYHMACLMPPLASIPEGHWDCDDCVNQKFLEIRDDLIQESRLFVRVDCGATALQNAKVGVDPNNDMGIPDAKKQKIDNSAPQQIPVKAGDIMLRPSSPAIESVRKLAACIGLALASA